jgi:hypothetical protein
MPIFWLYENAYLFCMRSLKKNYLLPFTYPPDVREKKFLFSDAWAIAEAYVGFCVGFTYPPDPAVKCNLLHRPIKKYLFAKHFIKIIIMTRSYRLSVHFWTAKLF